MTGERGQLVIPGEDPESRKRDHLKLLWIPAFAGMTGERGQRDCPRLLKNLFGEQDAFARNDGGRRAMTGEIEMRSVT